MDYDDQIKHQQASMESQIAAASDLAQLMDGLGSELVTIGVMRFVDGLTQDEIAEAMSLSRRTIVKRLKKFDAHIASRRAAAAKEAP